MSDRLVRRAPFLILAAAVLALAVWYPPQRYGIWADQMTYYLQANSIAYDGDLRFDERDLARYRRHGWSVGIPARETIPHGKGPIGLYLREHEGRFFYSKPFLYSLLAAPAAWLAPVRGPIVVNALLWLALVEITFCWYRRYNPPGRAATFAAFAWIGSAAPFYIFVIHTDLTVAALLAGGLYLWLTSDVDDRGCVSRNRKTGDNQFISDSATWGCVGSVGEINSQSPVFPKPVTRNPKPKTRSIARLLLAGLLLGLAVYEKNPFVFFAAAVVGSLLWRREFRATLVFAGITAVAFALPTTVHLLQDGNFSPYQGRRVYCAGDFPFDDLEAAVGRVESSPDPGSEFSRVHLVQRLFEPERVGRYFLELPRNFFYYIAGRKTGLFPWLTPALIALILWLALRQWRRGGSAWLAAALAAYVLFYFFVLSAWYGGPTALGNRYALQALPGFLLLPRRLPARRASFAALTGILIAATLYFPGSELLRPYGKLRDNIALMQKARFRWLPLEWHLAWFMADTPQAVADLGPAAKVVRLTDLNPTFDSRAYFMSSPRHGVALLTREPAESILIRVAARANPYLGRVGACASLTAMRSGSREVGFMLFPYESRLIEVPLALRGHAVYRRSEAYCHFIEVVTSDPLERDEIYPEDYYRKIGPFIDWWPVEASPSTGPATVVPDDPRDGGLLLWGWHAPEPPDDRGMRVRWAGEADESAFVVSRTRPQNLVLRVEANAPLAVGTELVWNGHSAGRRTIGPGVTEVAWTIAADLVRSGENVVCLRHDTLWRPADLTGNPDGDRRLLAVHYLRLIVEPESGSF